MTVTEMNFARLADPRELSAEERMEVPVVMGDLVTTCPACHADVPTGVKVCHETWALLAVSGESSCPGCGKDVEWSKASARWVPGR